VRSKVEISLNTFQTSYSAFRGVFKVNTYIPVKSKLKNGMFSLDKKHLRFQKKGTTPVKKFIMSRTIFLGLLIELFYLNVFILKIKSTI
jgi:hypothetical protein